MEDGSMNDLLQQQASIDVLYLGSIPESSVVENSSVYEITNYSIMVGWGYCVFDVGLADYLCVCVWVCVYVCMYFKDYWKICYLWLFSLGDHRKGICICICLMYRR